MGRYPAGPFPPGSVLCTYGRPLKIQYNTIPSGIKKCKFDAFWYHFKDRAKKVLSIFLLTNSIFCNLNELQVYLFNPISLGQKARLAALK